MGIQDWLHARTPYRYKGNFRRPYAGFGVAERGFTGTEPGAPSGLLVDIAGMGGILVKRDIKPAANFVVQTGGAGGAQTSPIGGLTGGLYQVGQLTATALSQYQQQQAYNGTGTPPPLGQSFAG